LTASVFYTTVCAQIRAKEALKLEAEMTRNPEDMKRLAMLQRLPELTRIVRAYLFVTVDT